MAADTRHPGSSSRAAADILPLVDREIRSPILRWMMHLGLPLSVSLAIHVLFFALLALRSWQVFGFSFHSGDYEVGIRNAAETPEDQTLKWPGEHALDLDQTGVDPDVDPFLYSGRRAQDAADLDDLINDERLLNPGESGVGGFGVGTAGRSGILGTGGGSGGGGGGGLGEGFGSGAGIGQAQVWSLRATGNTFAYVVDFSGSIIVAVEELRRELKRSVGMLTSDQLFAVYIFYSLGDEASQFRTEAFSPRLLPATPENKRRFFTWIDSKRPRGRTEPMQAVRRALAQNPEAVFFFSDGLFDERVVSQIAQENQAVHAQFHCLVFDELLLTDVSGLPHLTEGAQRLIRIADQNHGKAKVVTGKDLEK